MVEPNTVGSCFMMVRFTTIHFYNPCRVGPSTPNLWCITVTTPASFLYLVHFQIFSDVHVFLLFLFQCSSFKLTVIFPPMTSIKKTDFPLLQKEVKRTRKTLTLETRMLVIRKMEAGQKCADVCSSLAWHRLLLHSFLCLLSQGLLQQNKK